MKDKQLMLAVLAQLEREKSVSIPQLSSLLGASEDEIAHALDLLVYAYDSASVRLDLHDTFATLDSYGTERLLRLSPAEADALVDALSSAGFTADDELVQSLIKTKSMLQATESASEPRLHIIASVSTPQVIEALSAACEDSGHHLAEIAYRGIKDQVAQQRIIEPYGIFSEDDHRYLLAFDRGAEDWRCFRVDRVESVKVLEESFALRKSIPDGSVALESAGITATVVFEADCSLPAWRGSRVVETRPDGSRVVTLPWTGSPWLAKQVVSFTGKAVVESPATLERMCVEYAQELLQAASMQ